MSERRCLQREVGVLVEGVVARPAERTLEARTITKLIRRLPSRAADDQA